MPGIARIDVKEEEAAVYHVMSHIASDPQHLAGILNVCLSQHVNNKALQTQGLELAAFHMLPDPLLSRIAQRPFRTTFPTKPLEPFVTFQPNFNSSVSNIEINLIDSPCAFFPYQMPVASTVSHFPPLWQARQ